MDEGIACLSSLDTDSLRQRANAGSPEAQFVLAVRCYKGTDGVGQDYPQAVIWFRKASDQGYAHAQAWLGYMYENGKGMPENYPEARVWYQKAADQGDANAQYQLGSIHRYGRPGIPQNYSEALIWFQKAADQRHGAAQNDLGAMYHDGQGVPPDHSKALVLFHKAADQGYAHAQTWLGHMYEGGEGVPQDDAVARTWFEKAADQGDKTAKNRLAELDAVKLIKERIQELVKLNEKMERLAKETAKDLDELLERNAIVDLLKHAMADLEAIIERAKQGFLILRVRERLGICTDEEIDAVRRFREAMDEYSLGPLGNGTSSEKMSLLEKMNLSELKETIEAVNGLRNAAENVVAVSETVRWEGAGSGEYSSSRNYQQNRVSENEAYELLGVTAACTDEELKEAYHQKVNYWHPDKFHAAQIPIEMKELATREMARVNEAYRELKKLRSTAKQADPFTSSTESRESFHYEASREPSRRESTSQSQKAHVDAERGDRGPSQAANVTPGTAIFHSETGQGPAPWRYAKVVLRAIWRVCKILLILLFAVVAVAILLLSLMMMLKEHWDNEVSREKGYLTRSSQADRFLDFMSSVTWLPRQIWGGLMTLMTLLFFGVVFAGAWIWSTAVEHWIISLAAVCLSGIALVVWAFYEEWRSEFDAPLGRNPTTASWIMGLAVILLLATSWPWWTQVMPQGLAELRNATGQSSSASPQQSTVSSNPEEPKPSEEDQGKPVQSLNQFPPSKRSAQWTPCPIELCPAPSDSSFPSPTPERENRQVGIWPQFGATATPTTGAPTSTPETPTNASDGKFSPSDLHQTGTVYTPPVCRLSRAIIYTQLNTPGSGPGGVGLLTPAGVNQWHTDMLECAEVDPANSQTYLTMADVLRGDVWHSSNATERAAAQQRDATGIGNEGGLGLGEGFNTGGGVPNAGTGGYGTPACLYCPQPQFSDEAVAAKVQGTVLLIAIITADGRATDIRVAKALGQWSRSKGRGCGCHVAIPSCSRSGWTPSGRSSIDRSDVPPL